ncbi:hypothetical protein D3822_30495, partial [Escherichia coli]
MHKFDGYMGFIFFFTAVGADYKAGTGDNSDVSINATLNYQFGVPQEINVARSDTYGWQEDSTYIRLSPFFDE